MKKKESKKTLLQQLEKTPIVSIACQKSNVSRSTYYRWQKENPQFKEQSAKILNDGILMVNDIAESQLINLIKEKNVSSIIFWLKVHHPSYSTKIELSQTKISEQLTPEQTKLLEAALKIVQGNAGKVKYDQKNTSKQQGS